ncbi:cuticle protein CP14.6-like [Anthonomus grandis grandis]|uniref:cuticle protein CP14.6-like n=1 Tax=Anthonomus grandis grandis TaxID=2921223 RepID=UPI0021651060|nr:cuticle protein CP14.6-like [Anthonomus grandis grandis]
MKIIILGVLALATVAVAAPPSGADASATIVRLESDNIGVDGFRYSYETSNGIAADEQGTLIAGTGKDDQGGIATKGSFKYVGPDGVTYTITFIADANGFQPQGAHLPVGPK